MDDVVDEIIEIVVSEASDPAGAVGDRDEIRRRIYVLLAGASDGWQREFMRCTPGECVTCDGERAKEMAANG